jgi:hypothetical protein
MACSRTNFTFLLRQFGIYLDMEKLFYAFHDGGKKLGNIGIGGRTDEYTTVLIHASSGSAGVQQDAV